MNDIREMCGREKFYVYEDPKKCEIRLYTRHEAKHLNHARLGQCPNCGANDWSPTFMLRYYPIVKLPYVVNSVYRRKKAMAIKKELEDQGYGELYEVINYSCAYCGTRKEKDNAD
jgi:rubrerythrin